VHLLLSVNSRDPERRDAEQRRLRELVEATEGLRVVAEHLADSLLNSREHFGFADGLAQPDIEGVAPGGRRQAAAAGGGVPLPGAGWRPLRLGEFVLGYTDEDGETNEGPDAGLVRNGTFMVYRRLEQRVFAFREALRDAALETGLSQETVAAKLVGRWRDGMPLELAPRRDVDDLSDVQAADPPNDFRYLPHDRTGDVCPVGAHIRRANPRDAIDFGGAVEDSGPLTARHRIIRRGMPYGESLPAGAKKEDNAERGLLFVCFNANIARQFETVQANWCNDGDTFGLRNDQDYLFGNADGSGTMTVPVRGSHPRFVRVPDGIVATRGAEYLLLPSLDALRGLAVGTFR
jgi:Dyp-type peroxidase family